MNDSGTFYGFQEHWFFYFGLSLDLGLSRLLSGLVFLDLVFYWFFWIVGQKVFRLDIVVLVNQSTDEYKHIVKKYELQEHKRSIYNIQELPTK